MCGFLFGVLTQLNLGNKTRLHDAEARPAHRHVILAAVAGQHHRLVDAPDAEDLAAPSAVILNGCAKMMNMVVRATERILGSAVFVYLLHDLIERCGAHTDGRRAERLPIDRHRADLVAQIGQLSTTERDALVGVGRRQCRRHLRASTTTGRTNRTHTHTRTQASLFGAELRRR